MIKLVELAQSPPPSVPVDTTASGAVATLRQSRSGALVVVENGALAGVLSERDLVHRVVGEGRDPRTTLVRDVMTREPTTSPAESSIDAAFDLMIARHVRHLVLVDAEKRPVGLVSLRALAQARMENARDQIRMLQDYTNDSLGG
jgi:CBS domain-containing protein